MRGIIAICVVIIILFIMVGLGFAFLNAFMEFTREYQQSQF